MNFMCSKEKKGYFNPAEDISIAGVIEIVQSQESMKLYSYRIHDAIALYPCRLPYEPQYEATRRHTYVPGMLHVSISHFTKKINKQLSKSWLMGFSFMILQPLKYSRDF